MTDLEQFITAHEGVTTDVDGMFGGQCWDLWSAYAQECHGVPQASTNTTSGYADSVWTTKYESDSQLRAKFDKLGADETAQPGDVAFWAFGSAAYPQSHVAIVLQDSGSALLCLSQNPGPPQRLSLTKSGLLGYLRPKQTQEQTQETEGINMAELLIIDDTDNGTVWYWNVLIGRRRLSNTDQMHIYEEAGIKTIHSSSAANWMAVCDRQTMRGSEAGSGIINDISVTTAAQTAAIDALSKAMGADPDQIANAVESAVKAKLDQLEITVSVADGQD